MKTHSLVLLGLMLLCALTSCISGEPDICIRAEKNGNTVSFDIACTSDNFDTYDWKFGDGGGSQAVRPSHTYGSAGTYYVTVNLIGANGERNAAEKITVP